MFFCHRLITYLMPPSIRGIRVIGENFLSYEVNCYLKGLMFESKLKAVTVHVPNEGKRSIAMGRLFKIIGMLAGTSDWIIMAKDKNLAIELKIKGGRQNPNQKLFQEYCETVGVPYLVCYSVADVKAALKKHHFIL